MAERRIRVSGDLTSDEKFKSELERIRDKGFIKSHRSGDTGIGKTLEDELGVEENSVQASDIGDVELKANRLGSNSKVTLFQRLLISVESTTKFCARNTDIRQTNQEN